MIRLLIFSLIRFFIAAVVIYGVLTLVKGVIRALLGSNQTFTQRFRRKSQQENSPQATENYKDVKDAKFVELPKEEMENNQDRPT